MVEMQLAGGKPLTVQIPANASFLNAQRIEATAVPDDAEAELRYTGYLPGQTLTIEGAWQGDQRLIAQTFYAGTADDYLNFLTYTQPGMALLMGTFCSGVGGLLLAVAGIMRVLG